jgi:cyanophycinase
MPLRLVPSLRRAAAVAALAAATACAAGSRPSSAPAPAPHRGTLFHVGGGPQPPALVREFVDLAGGPGHSRIVVFARASADGAAAGEAKAADLRALGAAATNVWVTRAQANTDSAARLLDGATGVWFVGGDQARLAAALGGTRTEQAIHARYDAGAVIAGPPADSADGWLTIAREDVVTADGFGFVTDAVVDQHFVRRKRHNRLISLVLERPARLGVGIDESTALVVEPDGRWRVAGASVAVVYDARRGRVTAPGTTLGAADVTMHVLPAGSRYDPRSGVATLPGAR